MEYIIEKKKKVDTAQFNKEILFRIYSVIVFVYLLAVNNVSSEITGFIAVLLSVPFIVYPEYALPLLFVCSINGEYMVAVKGIGMARIFTIVFIVGQILFLLIRKEKVLKGEIVFYAFLCVYMFVSAYFSVTGELDPAYTMILNILVLFLMSYSKTNLKFLFDNIMIMSVLLSVYYFFIVFIEGDFSSAESLRLTIDEDVNPNSFAMSLAQLAAFNFSYFIYSKNILKRFILLSALALNCTTLFVTGSRSAAIGLVCGALCGILLCVIKKSDEIKINRFLLVAGFLAAVIGCMVYVHATDTYLAERFTLENVFESGGTGRLHIWETLLTKVFPQFILFGVGNGGKNVSVEVSRYLFEEHSSHNIFISMLLQFGILGFILLFGFLLYHIITFVKNYSYNALILIPFSMVCTIIFNGIGEDTFGMRTLWFSLGLALMICRRNKVKNKKEVSSVYIKSK